MWIVSNRKRALQGLPKLPRGPKFSPATSNKVLSRFQELGEELKSKNVGKSNVWVNADEEIKEEYEQNEQDPIDIEPGNESVTASEPEFSREPLLIPDHQSSDVTSPQIIAMEGSLESSPTLRSFQSGTEDIISIRDVLHSPSNVEDEQEASGVMIAQEEMEIHRALSFSKFRSWCKSNRRWVLFGVKFALAETVMNTLLENISAPYKCWKTVRRNLEKYTGLSPISYRTCGGHMLLEKASSATERDEVATDNLSNFSKHCSICHRHGKECQITSFEYLPLLPRLRAWVRDEKACEALYNYKKGKRDDVSVEQSDGFEDYLDGSLYKKIALALGGDDKLEDDIFIAPSCDGFQPFGNKKYDCWPLVALNHNLPPQMRFLMWNVIPLGFIKGPREPVQLHTYFQPLLDEIREINYDGGTPMQFWDGSLRKIRVHILWITGDSPAIAKIAGLTGSNGKCPCRFCEISGYRHRGSNHYYFPSKLRVRHGQSTRYQIFYDPNDLVKRTNKSVRDVWKTLENHELSTTQRRKLSIETGLKERTVVMNSETIYPFLSFPIDTMHLVLNVTKDLMEIWKGENVHLQRCDLGSLDFVIGRDQWRMIDEDFSSIGSGTCEAAFGPVPMDSSFYYSWKAAQCKEFVVSYAPVLLEGHLPRRIMDSVWDFSNIVELSSRPFLSTRDVESLGGAAVSFFQSYERNYFCFDPERVGLCKSTIHQILHLRECIEACGPPANYNQFWVERYIGFVKNRLNASNMAAESLLESEKLLESYKAFYGESFSAQDKGGSDTGDINLKFPEGSHSVSQLSHSHMNLRRLLCEYIMKTNGISMDEAQKSCEDDAILCFGAVEKQFGDVRLKFGAKDSKRHSHNKIRPDYFVSAEFKSDQSSEGCTSVYYGRIRRICQYNFVLSSVNFTRVVLIIDWASGLHKTRWGQVYHSQSRRKMFVGPTVEDPSVLLNLIGVMKHVIPSGNPIMRKEASANGREYRSYILDPYRRIHNLLDKHEKSPDGINRTLFGIE